MPVSLVQFWQLLGESRLLAPEDCQRRQRAFDMTPGAAQATSQSAAQWLLKDGAVSRYQAKVLLAGRPGPFFYGDYRVQERYDAGRLAGLFQAFHAPSGHPVLLQFLAGAVTRDRELWNTAARNAQQARRVVAPQVSRLFELVDLVTFKFAVHEDLRGEVLQRVAGGRPLPPPEGCRIARLAAIGLSYLHQHRMPHGEVRPYNIWVEANGNVKLLGAGLSHDLATPAGYFSFAAADPDGIMLSKADYLAPELARAGAKPTVLSDVYALGCTLYELLSGRPPFAGGTAADKARRHATEAIQPLDSLGVPPSLAQVVAFMMAKDPSLRYQEAGQLVEVLMNFVAPAAIQVPVERASPTLGVFQNMLEQRAAAASKAAAQAANPPIPNFQTGPPRSASPAGSAMPALNVATAPRGEFSVSAAPSDRSVSPQQSQPTPQRKKKSNSGLWIGLGVAAAVVVIGYLAMNGSGKHTSEGKDTAAAPIDANNTSETDATPPESSDPPPDKKSPATKKSPTKDGGDRPRGKTTPPAGDEPAEVEREQKIADDGKSLWASPTSGKPLDLKYLAPGGLIYLAVRPADLLASSEGDKLVAALGPTGAEYLAELQRLSGLEASQIEQVVISMQAGKDGQLEASLTVRPRKPVEAADLLDKWNSPTEEKHGERTFYAAGPWAYYLPSQEKGSVIAIVPRAHIREVLDAGTSPPSLGREMEEMLADTDASRHFTLLLPPRYLFTDGESVLSGTAAILREPLFWFLGDDKIQAASLSLHVSDNFFAELRVAGTIDAGADTRAKQVHDRLKQVPDDVESYAASVSRDPYAKLVTFRFPSMIRSLARHTRSGSEHRQAVLRSYLPPIAAHNLLMGFELTLAQQGGGGGSTAVASNPGGKPATPAGAGDGSVASILQKKASLSFPRDTLEVSMKLLSEEIGVEISIIGGDLQLDGITKNQSFGIDLRDQPAAKILEQVLVLANPDKTVKVPSDIKQKLVYVVKPKDPGGKEMIFITTRAQAEKRGDKLPEAFVVK